MKKIIYFYRVFFILTLIVFALMFINCKKDNSKIIETNENIVFLGDSITEQYDLNKYYKYYNVVNSGVSGNQSSDIVNDMYKRVYRYNPTKVILLIGINDLDLDVPDSDILTNIENIIEGIKTKLPNCKIYLESIYPTNSDEENEKIIFRESDSRNNNHIKNLNREYKRIAKEEKIEYIDLYDLLLDGDMLDEKYTKEGLHISEEGYYVITKEIKKIINSK